MKKIQYEYVEWHDACGQSGWMNAEDAKDPMQVRSVGIVMKETPLALSLSPGITEDGQFMGFITIPKGWIRKRKKLKV